MRFITLFMKNLGNRVNLFACLIAVFFIISPSYAHRCILEGNDAADISRYNSCKADLNIAAIHAESSSEVNENELERLRVENRLLKAKLDQMRQQLLSILSDF